MCLLKPGSEDRSSEEVSECFTLILDASGKVKEGGFSPNLQLKPEFANSVNEVGGVFSSSCVARKNVTNYVYSYYYN